jgi:NADH-quinone oxidoreductase subunit N
VNEEQIVAAIARSFTFIWPEALLVLGACVLFLGGTWKNARNIWGAAALITLGLAAVTLAFGPTPNALDRADLYAGPLVYDKLAVYIKVLALVSGAVLVLSSWNEVADSVAAEYHACLLLIVAGMGLTGMANELVILFLALELISIPTYVLLYLARRDRPAQEAAMKYFLLSVFSSALLLFGFSYLYGLVGTTNLPALTSALAETMPSALPGLALVALVMIVAGLGFRITAVPFHFYAPDVYQGTTAALAGLLAFVPKLAGFIALLRVLGFIRLEGLAHAPAAGELTAASGPILGGQLPTLLWILAAVTMTLGNILALLQDNLKRLLAYSSVAHAGYMLIGLAAAAAPHGASNETAYAGVEAVLFYLVAYGSMTIGAFAVIACLHTPEQPVETVAEMTGLSRSHPRIALVMALFLFSLIGIPATAGFVGKWLVFWGAMGVPAAPEAGAVDQARLFRILAFIAVLNAAVGAWYYLRIIAVMYLREPARRLGAVRSRPALIAVAVCAVLTLWLGIYPQPLQTVTHQAAPPPPALTAAPPAGDADFAAR